LDKITDLAWKPASPSAQLAFGEKAMHDWHVQSLQTCSTCHR